ncbi:MAG: thermostable hemolysin [Gammaproteobacteria bacterium]|nr:MAG: thermostable hemolysin [Gammaproteobacteria bacterium]RLA14092.1 MAG: thermostable hemolysin [Gammaproteobacteria bacterium]RLA17795.1 MAG: thermostable hemolysin [Gammaproteobacteria bacterium]
MNSPYRPMEFIGHSSVAARNGVLLVYAGHPMREQAELYIQRVYRRSFAAKIHHFSPLLLVWLDSRQRIQGVVGLTQAEQQTLFLEQYLRAPVEQVLAEAVSDVDCRRNIVEIGNLAMVDRSSVRKMICFLSEYLAEQEVEWVVFTAMAELFNSFKRLGLPLTHLAAADPGLLGNDVVEWGSYYDGLPQVVAGRVAEGLILQTASPAVAGSVKSDTSLDRIAQQPLLPLPCQIQPAQIL